LTFRPLDVSPLHWTFRPLDVSPPGRFATWTCQSQSLLAGWPPMCSSIDRILLKSVQWFCRCGWSKIALPLTLAIGLYNRLYGQKLVLPYRTVQAVNCHCLVNKIVSDARRKRIRNFHGCETCRFVKLQLTL